MISLTTLPALNAVLNAISAMLLSAGYVAIARRHVVVHKYCMVSACVTSLLFLISYLTYHYAVGSKPFAGEGGIRIVYFVILISHTILATVIVPLVLMTLWRAITSQWVRHRRIARWTFPLWLYVSVTGVVIYMMLYQMYPAS